MLVGVVVAKAVDCLSKPMARTARMTASASSSENPCIIIALKSLSMPRVYHSGPVYAPSPVSGRGGPHLPRREAKSYLKEKVT